MEKISIKDVYKDYNGVPVINGITVEIKKGSFVSIMGESGSGKSTLLNILSTLLPPSSGSVFYDETNVYSLTEKDRSSLRCHSIGIVYQFFNLISTLTVQDNILLPIFIQRKDKKAAFEEMKQLSGQLGIENCLKKYPKEISGGQQQRAAIARCLLYHPSFMFLDEPTGNLDSKNSTQIMELMRTIVNEKGVTLVQVTHSRATALYGDRILHIQDGRIIQDETLL